LFQLLLLLLLLLSFVLLLLLLLHCAAPWKGVLQRVLLCTPHTSCLLLLPLLCPAASWGLVLLLQELAPALRHRWDRLESVLLLLLLLRPVLRLHGAGLGACWQGGWPL
jgi:hypothetical protein